jgi:penicillin-insensitive murein endopeptidase
MEKIIRVHRILKLGIISSLSSLAAVLVLSTVISSYADSAITESIGAYTAGCIRNAAALPANGKGFQVIRLGRGRFYANTSTVDYIRSLGRQVDEQLDGILLIGDVSQKTGGPMLDEHSSHQIGLDADILFWQHPIAIQRTLTDVERAHIYPQSVLTEDETRVDEFKWDDRTGEIIKLAAADARVERIFVNPVIKRKLCMDFKGEKWLAKIRPWYGHDGHFHVRLKCPSDNNMCEPQEPINMFDDGCGAELASWFRSDGSVRAPVSTGEKRRRPKLPEACIPILNGLY